jgi:plastocyanin
MSDPLRVGIALIAVGLVGLLVLGVSSWDGAPWPRPHGPMMRGFGRHPMFDRLPPGARELTLPPVAGARIVEVAATDFSFRPAEITVKAGEVINLRLVNQGVAAHDLVIPAVGIWLLAAPGQSMTGGVTFDRPGEYEFFCSVPGHRDVGMIGRIVVTP